MAELQAELEEVSAGAGAERESAPGMRGMGKHTAIYGLGMILSKGVGFLMLPVYTRFLTPADYGVLELIEMTLDLVSIIAGAQLALGIFRYYHKAQSLREKRAVVSTALLGLGVSYVTVGAAAYLAAAPLSSLVFASAEHASLIRIAAINLAFQSLLIVPLAYARVRDRSRLFISATLVKTSIALTLNIIFLVVLGMGVKGLLTSSLISSAVVGSVLAVGVFRDVGLRFSRNATRDLLRYGAPMMATQIATFATTFGDRYFLQAAGDSTVVGLYTLAYQFGFLVAYLGAVPFIQVWDPKRFALANHPDRDAMYARGFIYLNVLLLTVTLVVALFVKDMLRVMTTPPFLPAADLVPLILVAYVLQSWTSVQDIGILIRERTELVMLGNWVAALTALIGYAIFVPRFLAWGAAGVTVVAFAVRHVTLFTISQRLWPVRYDWPPVLRLLTAALLTFAIASALPEMEVWYSVLARGLLLAGYLWALWRMDVLSGADRVAVRNMVGSLKVRLGLHTAVPHAAAPNPKQL